MTSCIHIFLWKKWGSRYFKLRKKWEERASKRISSVGFASPREEARSIVSSMKHTSSVVRLDFSIHLPLTSTTVSFFFCLPLRVYISSVDAVECDKVEFQHMILLPSCTRDKSIFLFSFLNEITEEESKSIGFM